MIPTLRVARRDAVLHFPVQTRVLVARPQSPDPGPRLPLRHLEGPLIGSGEGGGHVVHVQDVHQHLGGGAERERDQKLEKG